MAKKAEEFNLTKFNSGYAPREIKEGDRVTIYRIPYRQKSPIYTGTVVKVYNRNGFSAYCDVKKDGTDSVYGESVYLGKIWEGWGKP